MAETSVRNAVVTGAAGGMGRAITEALLESGRRVVLVDRDPESLRQFAAKMGFDTVAIARGRDKAPLAKEMGARAYIDSQAQDPAAVFEALCQAAS